MGGAFFLVLVALLFVLEHYTVLHVTDLFHLSHHADKGMTAYELSIFFTVFVMLQFWNMFNARAFCTGRSAFHLKGCKGFLFIAAFILVGQIAIVQLGGDMFNVSPLSVIDWALIIIITSLVLWLGEGIRFITKWIYKCI